MGIVPENQHLLGLEGAGLIRRVGKHVESLKIGQRALVFEKGTFANRIIATVERVYPLPDSLSFEVMSRWPMFARFATDSFPGCIDDAKCLSYLHLQSLRSGKYATRSRKLHPNSQGLPF